jgi:hypothetical protein
MKEVRLNPSLQCEPAQALCITTRHEDRSPCCIATEKKRRRREIMIGFAVI